MKSQFGIYIAVALVTILLGASALSSELAPGETDRSKVSRPNIVLILSDDMGFSDIGCYGGEIETPNLDRLAANGLRFTQFYNTARCCPTRASLLTGLYPHQAGVGHMMEDKGEKFPGYRGNLNTNCRTIAEVLHKSGYGCYMAGKWHVTRFEEGKGPKDNWPLQRGFDKYYGMISGAGSFFDPFTLVRGNDRITPMNDREYHPEQYYFTDAITDNGVRFVESHLNDRPSDPFFLYMAYTAAHWPMHALPEDIEKYRGRYSQGYEAIRDARLKKQLELGVVKHDQLSPATDSWNEVANKHREEVCMEVYAAMVDRMDQGIGKVIATLERHNQLENTIIFYLQDNGGCAEPNGRNLVKGRLNGPRPTEPTLPPRDADFLVERGAPAQTRDGFPVRQGPDVLPGPADTFVAYGRAWANVSNTPFREFKHWVHEGGISTPLVVHWPNGFSDRNAIRDTPGHLIDIMATCVDVAQADYPADAIPLEGTSLVPVFQGQALAERSLYWEHEGNRAIRRGKWKGVAKNPAGSWELYDIEKDRIEKNDLGKEHPELLRELVRDWESFANRANVLPWIWEKPYQSIAD